MGQRAQSCWISGEAVEALTQRGFQGLTRGNMVIGGFVCASILPQLFGGIAFRTARRLGQ
jgi:hypothetical protein